MKRILSLSLVLMLLAVVLTGCGASGPAYTDGTYEGEAEGMYPLKVSVEVADGKITAVNLVEEEETEGIADPALEQIPAAIVEKNSTEVDVVSGATMTSNGIIAAVNAALEGAK